MDAPTPAPAAAPSPDGGPRRLSPRRRRAKRILRPRLVPSIARWVDERSGTASFARKALDKVFPDHWSFMFGELALYCFIVLIVTGVFLTFFFEASTQPAIYHGSYVPMQGREVSAAYESALRLSFDVRAGLVMRQAHHWAALLFAAATIAHMGRIFFTGAYRRPRELNWMIGVTLMLLVVVNGFFGYSLLDDQLSGTGLRIAYGIVLSVPVVGTWIASLFFGGEFPGPDVLQRFYILHVLVVPVIIGLLLSVHLFFVVRHKHTHFPGHGARDDNVVGERMWPTYAFKGASLFFFVSAMVFALAGLAQINPIWLYGPYKVADVSAASQPDWYMAWLDGALRIMPPWEIRFAGFEIPNPFFSGALLGGLSATMLYLVPFIDDHFTRSADRDHNVLARPRDHPLRTALGIAAVFAYLVFFAAAATDVLAVAFSLSINQLIWFFRFALFIVPTIAALVAYRLCQELQARDGPTPPQPPPGGPTEPAVSDSAGAPAGSTRATAPAGVASVEPAPG